MGAESRLLYDERPLVVIPELAVVVGLNDAIVLQQIHYWVRINQRAEKNFRDGYYWTYNTYDAWGEQFPFWSISTIKRIFLELESDGLIITGNFNRLVIDRTKWYRLDYDKLSESVNMIRSTSGNDTLDGSNRDDGRVKMALPLPEITTQITSNNKIDDIWNETLTILKERVSGSNFRTWLKDLVPLSFDGEVFVVAARNNFIAEYLNMNQRSLIESKLITVIGSKVEFILQVAPHLMDKEGVEK